MDELNFTFKMPDDETLAKYISIKGEKGEKGDPTKLSDLENDEGFITADTDELTNYYTKAQTDGAIEADIAALKTELGVPAGFFTDASETVTGEGSSITLTGTANAVFKEIKLYGDTLQESTPTAQNPAEVQTVTGDQIIIVSDDNQQSQSYTLSLGSMKLCAIGDTKDYIYKNGDKWFKHKAISFVTITSPDWNALNGTSAGTTNTSSNGAFCFFWTYNHIPALSGQLVSNYMAYQSQTVAGNAAANTMADNTFVQRSGTNDRLYYRNTSLIGKTGIELTEMMEGLELYYVMATPVEEEITDLTLVKQLAELEKANSYAERTVISISGSLASPLRAEAYKDNWSGTISGINKELDNVYTKSETDSLLSGRVQFIFPKFWANAWSGDCNLIKQEDKNILIDCYNGSGNLAYQYTYVKAMLDDNDAKHIDVFICSHYHGDHIGSFSQLVTDGYIDASTKLFMPAETTQFWGDTITTWKNYCTSHNLDYHVPDEGETYTIGSLKFTFMNCDGEALDDYYPSGTGSQNATSTVVLVEHKNTKALYTGDAEKATYERLQELDFPNCAIDLHKMGHHGISQRTNPEYIRKLAPKFAVQTSGIKDAIKNNYGICEETAVLKAIGTKIYPTHMQTDYLTFESDGSSIQCLKGKPYGTSDQRITLTYYVDINAATNSIQDGSEDYPFSELMQAISSIPFKSGVDVTINVADGYYGNSHEGEWQKNRIYIDTGKDVRVTINGNSTDRGAVVINGIHAVSSDVKLKSLTLDIDNRTGIAAYSSYISLEDVVIKSNTDTATTHAGISAYEGSIILATAEGDGIRIDQCANAIELRSASTFRADHPVEIGTITGYPINRWAGCSVYTGNYFKFDNTADKYAFMARQETVCTPLQIMATHESFDQTVDLLNNTSNYSWVEIYYRTNDNIYGSTGKIYSPNGKSACAFVPFRAGDGTLYEKQCRFNISGTTITIAGSLQVHITSGSTPTIQENATYFNIERVIAGYTDFIDLNS